MPSLKTMNIDGLALLGDPDAPSRVCFAFTERKGGVSKAPFSSLNLSLGVGDSKACVQENRRRALFALHAAFSFLDKNPKQKKQDDKHSKVDLLLSRLIVPKQVHGDHIVCIRSSEPESLKRAAAEAQAGADAVVVLARAVPVCLCFADCVPLVFIAPNGAFALAHSGWRGTKARIAAKTLRYLCEAAKTSADSVLVYIGPHIAGKDYQVSSDLLQSFVDDFGKLVQVGATGLSLEQAIIRTLLDEGVCEKNLVLSGISTPEAPSQFYSWRAEGGLCGRHGALAFRA